MRNHYSSPPIKRIPYRRASSSSSGWKMLFFLVIIGIFWLYYYIGATGNIQMKAKTYDIEKGMTISHLDTDLDLGVASWRYHLWLRFFAGSPKLQIGQYVVSPGTTLSDFFLKNLRHPTYTDLTITVLPGWNIYDIDEYLAGKGVTKIGDVLSAISMNFDTYRQDFPFLRDARSLEGFLYPDTYRVRPKASVDSILRMLLSEWQKKIGTSYEKLGKEAYDTLILASIVEREERDIKNQPIVAGILKKRYNEGMPIGADATVCYGYAKTHKECTPSFIASVIADKNTYNTRNTRGYPPTPISSISLSTWNSVIGSQNSSFYYYLHDDSGKIHYARTLDEHVVNKREYLQ